MNGLVKLNFEHDPEPEFQLPIQNYHEFYRFYLTEHRNISSRRLHAFGRVYLFRPFAKPKYLAYVWLCRAWVGFHEK